MISINEDNKQTLTLTRGDAPDGEINKIAIRFPIYDFETEEIEYYEFQPTDKITFTIYDKKGYTKNEILKKEYVLSTLGYVTGTTKPELYITTEDTLKFPLTNKRATYYYEIVLNNTATIIGANEEGTNKVIVYPGVKDDDE